jgi:cell pole-organizing protein PopZ
MTEKERYIVEEKEKIRRFRWEMGDEISKTMWKAMDDVQKAVETIMPRIKEIIRRETETLRAFISNAPFNDAYLKETLYKSLDDLPNIAETFVIAETRRAVRKAFEILKDEVDEKTREALEGFELPIIPGR